MRHTIDSLSLGLSHLEQLNAGANTILVVIPQFISEYTMQPVLITEGTGGWQPRSQRSMTSKQGGYSDGHSQVRSIRGGNDWCLRCDNV